MHEHVLRRKGGAKAAGVDQIDAKPGVGTQGIYTSCIETFFVSSLVLAFLSVLFVFSRKILVVLDVEAHAARRRMASISHQK